ncbi:hypothetical protein NC651_009414 [Populus alba x Populus x berolinensis]|nr:hypothetical protein NC651_009414 [Populus alba x Populus x berolinensis]
MQLPSNLSVSQKTKESLLYKSDFLETSQHSEFKSTPIKDHSTINSKLSAFRFNWSSTKL